MAHESIKILQEQRDKDREVIRKALDRTIVKQLVELVKLVKERMDL